MHVLVAQDTMFRIENPFAKGKKSDGEKKCFTPLGSMFERIRERCSKSETGGFSQQGSTP